MKSSWRKPKGVVALQILSLFLLVGMANSWVGPSLVQGDSLPAYVHIAGKWEQPAGQSSGVSPSSGPPGTRITVSGSGFRSFATVESIVMRGLDILGNRTVNTDGNGQFEVDDLIVPGLDPGIVSLTVKVGTGDLQTTAVGTFEVTEGSGPSGRGVPAEDALAPLGDALERVFHFDNGTKTWNFYDPREAFSAFNTIDEIVEGRVYWVKVKESATVTLNASRRELTCANRGTPQEDCWNLVVW